MENFWYSCNLHICGDFDKCVPFYEDLFAATVGVYNDDGDQIDKPDEAFQPFHDGAVDTAGGELFPQIGNSIELQTGDDGIRGEVYDLFLPFIKKHPDVSLLFEGVADTDSSRSSFYFVFEKGKIAKKYYKSHDFSKYDDQDECIEARDKDHKKEVRPFVVQWLEEAKKSNRLYGGAGAYWRRSAQQSMEWGNFDNAINHMTKAIEEIEPVGDDLVKAVYYDERSAVHETIGNVRLAMDDAKKALELDPTFEKAKERLARLGINE